MTKEPELSFGEMFSFLSESLLRQAAEPNMHAYEPHEKQLMFHKSQAKGRLFIGGNRSGKTVGGVIEDLWWVTRRHPYRKIPSDVAIRGRVDGDGFEGGTIDEVLIPAFKRWILPSDLVNGSWLDSWNNTTKVLTLENKSFLEFKSYGQDTQRHAGTSRHFVHFDEEPPQSIYNESKLRLVDTGGSWWMTMTPLFGMNWVYYNLYLPGKEGRLSSVFVVEVESDENPYISEEDLSLAFEGMDEYEADSRRKGAFMEKHGLVFPEFGTEHLLKGPWYPQGVNWRIYQSIDSGYNNPTAILWHAVDPFDNVVTFGEHYKNKMRVAEHAIAIKKFEAKHGLTQIFARPGDPAMKQTKEQTGTSVVQEYALNGIYLNVETIPRDVKTGLDRMRSYMALSEQGKPRWHIVADQCPNLVRELPRLSWKTYDSEKARDRQNKLEEVKKKDDHAFDSARYFFTMMPKLGADKLWREPDLKPEVMDYMSALVQMANMQEDSGSNSWRPNGRGFSAEEYAFSDGMEF